MSGTIRKEAKTLQSKKAKAQASKAEDLQARQAKAAERRFKKLLDDPEALAEHEAKIAEAKAKKEKEAAVLKAVEEAEAAIAEAAEDVKAADNRHRAWVDSRVATERGSSNGWRGTFAVRVGGDGNSPSDYTKVVACGPACALRLNWNTSKRFYAARKSDGTYPLPKQTAANAKAKEEEAKAVSEYKAQQAAANDKYMAETWESIEA